MSATNVDKLTDRKLDALWTSPEPSLERQLHLVRLKSFAAARLLPTKRPLPADSLCLTLASPSKRSKVEPETCVEELIDIENISEPCMEEFEHFESLEEQLDLDDDDEDSGISDYSSDGDVPLEERLEMLSEVMHSVDDTTTTSEAFEEFFPNYHFDHEMTQNFGDLPAAC
ncbi:hypothetical protein QR680_010610 [Steinernema hermaphroditum]|uniref:Uncharacterized protein n=1 Tax=Steinernema hermaphroditum TaxID=289476 RepID=A0AA39IPK4_9BILA|nr:hypothetical protein QR680_010610 [Steinernema hermaphroditum]